jgi:hypothetical protein
MICILYVAPALAGETGKVGNKYKAQGETDHRPWMVDPEGQITYKNAWHSGTLICISAPENNSSTCTLLNSLSEVTSGHRARRV